MKRQEQKEEYQPDELNEGGSPSVPDIAAATASVDGSHAADGNTPQKEKGKSGKRRPGDNSQTGPEAKEATPNGDTSDEIDASMSGSKPDTGVGGAGRNQSVAGHGGKKDGTSSVAQDDMDGDKSNQSGSKGKSHPWRDLKNALTGGTKSASENTKGLLAGGGRSLMQSAADGVMHVGSVITGGVSKGVGKVATSLGVSKVTAGVLTAAIVLTGTAGGTAAISTWSREQDMLAHEYVIEDNCAEDVARVQSMSVFDGDDNAMQEANAAKAWSIFKAIGLTDEQAAGAVGNLYGEGGLSPYTMECDFITAPEEKWGVGPKKAGYIADLNSWTLNVVFPKYDANGFGLNKDFYNTSRHGYVAGVGLCGFTGCHYDDLEDWAAGMGTTWYDPEKAFDVQMSFILAPTSNGGYGRSGWLVGWKDDTSGCDTPESAAEVFCKQFEGNNFVHPAKLEYARRAYDKYKGTMGDANYANGVLELAQVSRAQAAGSGASKKADDCGIKAGVYDNSSLAQAAVAYAYETEAEGRGNNGTQLYQTLHERIFPGDPYFMSCDRGVATAVRWAGADDLFPAGACVTQLAHLQDNPNKWESLGPLTALNMSDLRPGDILICDGHITMYVGNEAVQKKYPNSSADMVSASLDDRSPGCGSAEILKNHDHRNYFVFRLKFYDENSRYKDIVKGEALLDK